MTFTIPNPPYDRLAQLASRFGFSRPAARMKDVPSVDATTGLLARMVFVEEASVLLERAMRERREVAVSSILVEGIDTDGERYSEPAANLLLRGAASALSRLETGPAVIGRIGLAEFGWVELIDSRHSAWRSRNSAMETVNRSIGRAGVDPAATASLGVALSRGRTLDIEELIAEARGARRRDDGASESAAS